MVKKSFIIKPPVSQKLFRDTISGFKEYIFNLNLDAELKSSYLNLLKSADLIKINKPEHEDVEVLMKILLLSTKTKFEKDMKRIFKHTREIILKNKK
ncbi:MAG: hypothetical protein JXR46_13325 [Calditrichaceae bacterium]|nr:hypothetical protein [Calditrichaceae bacterium]MBN2710017.1 hypothetical protein [Calditrichaceae bacterium]RQV93679.1 MAG: hypothetical protein EH224_11990 [Calditrichota bacterium]